jgi:hypothetical protein
MGKIVCYCEEWMWCCDYSTFLLFPFGAGLILGV